MNILFLDAYFEPESIAFTHLENDLLNALVMNKYIAALRQITLKASGRDCILFSTPSQAVFNTLNEKEMNKELYFFLKEAGIDGRASNGQSRIHDLRHNFAIHSLENAINSGMDPYCSLPILSTYMGHKGIESTEIYLRLTKHYFINFLKYSKEDADMLFPEVSDYE